MRIRTVLMFFCVVLIAIFAIAVLVHYLGPLFRK